MLRNLGRTRLAVLTGWAVDPNCRFRYQAHAAFPVTIYYAFKQSESDHDGTASTGWDTFLAAVIDAGFLCGRDVGKDRQALLCGHGVGLDRAA